MQKQQISITNALELRLSSVLPHCNNHKQIFHTLYEKSIWKYFDKFSA